MARIIAGTHGGRRIAGVPTDATRPTSDRVKESLFSRLQGYDAIEDAVTVDLFAGSGALGLEALSRGARSAELVDKAEAAYRTLVKNSALFGAQATVFKADARRFLQSRGQDPAREQIELLFLDPPYGMNEKELSAVLDAAVGQLHPAATLVVERDSHSPEPVWPPGLTRFHTKTYGSTQIWLAEPDDQAS